MRALVLRIETSNFAVATIKKVTAQSAGIIVDPDTKWSAEDLETLAEALTGVARLLRQKEAK